MKKESLNLILILCSHTHKGDRTQFLRALLLMRFSARTTIAKTNMPLIQRSLIFAQYPLYLCYFSSQLKAVCWRLNLVFYNKGMLKKRYRCKEPSNSWIFPYYRKNPVKCSACAVARKIETNRFCRNLPISNNPVVRFSRNLAKK